LRSSKKIGYKLSMWRRNSRRNMAKRKNNSNCSINSKNSSKDKYSSKMKNRYSTLLSPESKSKNSQNYLHISSPKSQKQQKGQ
jgi:hypothetical protein